MNRSDQGFSRKMSLKSWLSLKKGIRLIFIATVIGITYNIFVHVIQHRIFTKRKISSQNVLNINSLSNTNSDHALLRRLEINLNRISTVATVNLSNIPLTVKKSNFTAKWTTYTEIEIRKVDNMFPKDAPPVISATSPYLIANTELCSTVNDLTYIVVVHTAPKHFAHRQVLRRTWANHTFFRDVSGRVAFLIGAVLDEKLQSRIQDESKLFGDIVQGAFIDSYKNLTLKNVMGLRWITENCPNAKYVVKSDDDTFVNMHNVIKHVFPELSTHQRQLLCRVKTHAEIIRGGALAKWAVSKDFFKNDRVYPMPFCFGFFAFFSLPLAVGLFQQAKSTPFFVLDDVFVYGILASKIKGITWRNIAPGAYQPWRHVLTALAEKTLVAGLTSSPTDIEFLWNRTNV